MKKYIIAMVALLSTFFTTANAMSYEQAREQALFLTDKMAYELNLDEEQYEAAYEVNLDYLLSVNTYDDVFADYWIHRNEDLRYILLDWQYEAFCAATYFYRPLWWEGGYWHFGIYARYPHRDYFYFGRPHFYVTYRGGHGWHHNGGRSWYHTNFSHAHRVTHRGSFSGMRDGWNRGDYRGGRIERGTRSTHGVHGNHGGSGINSRRGGGIENHRGGSAEHRREGNTGGPRFGSGRESSTRTTVGRQGFNSSSSSSDRVSTERRSSDRSSFGHSSSERSSYPRSESSTRSFTPSRSTSTGSYGSSSHSSTRSGGSFGGSRSSGSSHGGGSFGGGSRGGGGSHGGGSHGGGGSRGMGHGGSR